MGIKTLFKIWFSLFWRTNLYIFTIQLYVLMVLSGIILYCLSQGLIPQLRELIFTVFGLSEVQSLERLSIPRLLITEGGNCLIYLFVLSVAIKRLPNIPFKGFRIDEDALPQAFMWLGPIAQGFYLLSYLGISIALGYENPLVQGLLGFISSVAFIPCAFRNLKRSYF
ncbi:MAG: hypothetical protein KF820_02645 [Candidatus Paracaedibacteraceae bacterium]|nr:hypothetical protein [Candidatus Paracaedibacteraceae bacterium]